MTLKDLNNIDVIINYKPNIPFIKCTAVNTTSNQITVEILSNTSLLDVGDDILFNGATSMTLIGEYSKRKRACIAYMESTVGAL